MRGVQIENTGLAAGEQGTLDTVRRIADLIREGRASALVRTVAEDVLEEAGVAPRDHVGEAEALFEFVRGHLVFRNDPIGVEMLTTADSLLVDHNQADCDEFVILLGSLLEAVGRHVRIKVVRAHRSLPWQHVYLEVRVHGMWVPADATNAHEPLGWEVTHGDARTFLVTDRPGVGFVELIPALVGAVGGLINDHDDAKAERKAAEKAEKAEKKRAKEDAAFRQQMLALAQGGAAPGFAPKALSNYGGIPLPDPKLPPEVTATAPNPTAPGPAGVATSLALPATAAEWKKLALPVLAGVAIGALLLRR